MAHLLHLLRAFLVDILDDQLLSAFLKADVLLIEVSIMNNTVSTPVAPNKQAFLPHRRPRLLIVSDSADRFISLKASLNVGEIEILSATSPEEIRQACQHKQDIVVVDVSPAQLIGVLRTLRESTGSVESSVLIEASRLVGEGALSGLLAEYRAMPCSHSELISLVRRRLGTDVGRPQVRNLL
jgi:CheY-like chemotaxis protein